MKLIFSDISYALSVIGSFIVIGVVIPLLWYPCAGVLTALYVQRQTEDKPFKLWAKINAINVFTHTILLLELVFIVIQGQIANHVFNPAMIASAFWNFCLWFFVPAGICSNIGGGIGLAVKNTTHKPEGASAKRWDKHSLMMIAMVWLVTMGLLVACNLGWAYYTYRRETQNLVGLWEKHDRYRRTTVITLRKADGTYRQKEVRPFDYTEPLTIYKSERRWEVDNILDRNYVVTTYGATALQKEAVKTWKAQIVKADGHVFEYISPYAIVTENKVGKASDVAFDRAKLTPFEKED
jgi:hypothetical protein